MEPANYVKMKSAADSLSRFCIRRTAVTVLFGLVGRHPREQLVESIADGVFVFYRVLHGKSMPNFMLAPSHFVIQKATYFVT